MTEIVEGSPEPVVDTSQPPNPEPEQPEAPTDPRLTEIIGVDMADRATQSQIDMALAQAQAAMPADNAKTADVKQ